MDEACFVGNTCLGDVTVDLRVFNVPEWATKLLRILSVLFMLFFIRFMSALSTLMNLKWIERGNRFVNHVSSRDLL